MLIFLFGFLLLLHVPFNVEANHEIDCNPHNLTHLELAWQQYKKKYNKTYTTSLEERRKQAWIINCERIYKHNEEAAQGIHSYSLKLNHLSDLSQKLYHREMIRLTQSRRRKLSGPEIVGAVRRSASIPEEIDWRDKGFVTPANNQRDCGSCYAFSIAHTIQAQVYKVTKNLVPLSEQQIIDCSSRAGNYGCNGGSLRNTLKYLDRVGGLETAADYPYVAKQTKCKFKKTKTVVNITTWAILPARDEHALEVAVATIGPVAASINASPDTFQLYHTGIYDDESCSANAVNHAMLIVGYTRDAWILKNWWGDHWGEKGYMRLRKNKNRCGVANYVAYATVD